MCALGDLHPHARRHQSLELTWLLNYIKGAKGKRKEGRLDKGTGERRAWQGRRSTQKQLAVEDMLERIQRRFEPAIAL